MAKLSATATSLKHVVLTGSPGVGKTTLVCRVCELLKQKNILLQGFYTEERRNGGQREGFDVVTLDGQRGLLASIGDKSDPKARNARWVGQYVVHTSDFEKLSLPVLTFKADGIPRRLFVIDEIGKMELFSESFRSAVVQLLKEDEVTLLATIPIKKQHPMPFVEEIRQRKDVKLFEVTKANRNGVLNEIVQTLEKLILKP